MKYWEDIAEQYQNNTFISCDDFHYGPLINGDSELKLLPERLEGLKCLEFACGGAQNSIYLAHNGARCTAIDSSSRQILYAQELAGANGVNVDLRCAAIEEMPGDFRSFDLIHSAYGFNFACNLDKLFRASAVILKEGGVIIFSIPHPLFSGEFMEIDDEPGLFLQEYFAIAPDLRFDEDGNETARSNFYNFSEISTVLSDNGFLIERISEPEICDNPPYTSKLWEEYRSQIRFFPATLVIKAVKSK